MLPHDTAHLRFRRMTAADREVMAALLGDPDVMRYYPAPKTRDEAAAWIAWNERNYAEYGHGLWIVETHAGEVVGDAGLTWQSVNGVRELEVGYHLFPAWQGRGLATEAAAACLDLAREHRLAPRLVAITHPDNRASQRVAERIGLRRTADDLAGALPVRVVHSLDLTDGRCLTEG